MISGGCCPFIHLCIYSLTKCKLCCSTVLGSMLEEGGVTHREGSGRFCIPLLLVLEFYSESFANSQSLARLTLRPRNFDIPVLCCLKYEGEERRRKCLSPTLDQGTMVPNLAFEEPESPKTLMTIPRLYSQELVKLGI